MAMNSEVFVGGARYSVELEQGRLSRMRNHLAGSLKPAGFKLRGLIPHLFLRLFQLPDHHEYTFVTRNHVAQPVKPTKTKAHISVLSSLSLYGLKHFHL
jgi:hypothetical protein